MGRGTDTFAAVCGLILLAGALGVVAHLDRNAPRPIVYQPLVPRLLETAAPFMQTIGDTGARGPGTPTTPPPPLPPPEQPSPEMRAQYDERRTKTVMELQQFRRVESISVTGSGGQQIAAALINLNPAVNSWFLLTIDMGPGTRRSFHLENSDPIGQQIHLDQNFPTGVLITAGGQTTGCNLWDGSPSALEKSSRLSMPYAALCDGRLTVRNRVAGYRTNLEAVTDFLRDNVWQGEEIVGFVRDSIFRDAYRETEEARKARAAAVDVVLPPADVGAAFADKAVSPGSFGIAPQGAVGNRFMLGRWYPARDVEGTYVSVMEPQAVSDAVILRNKSLLSPLDGVEKPALDYMVAFDLSRYEVRFAVGTDHPRLSWSPRALSAPRNGLPGPDGVAGVAPLVTTGMVNPVFLPRVGAAFTGGFKREHGAFKWGALATTNSGSHYGFVENGVVLSKLQPGLATLFTLDDGSIQMGTWTAADNEKLAHVRFARQNGVAVVESGTNGEPAAGQFVSKWGPGNWSGSADAQLRTIRAGVCLRTVGEQRFLIYGYFSTATPSAMAAVFLSYGCSYAMLLDMNAPVHTYLAVYAHRGAQIGVEHLVHQMADADQSIGGQLLPRFIGFPDNRDFFYLVRRREGP